MTELLFRDDAYQTAADCRITGHTLEGGIIVDRSIFYAAGQDPRRFEVVVVKSPHCEPHMFVGWAARNFNIDAPGATSANLRSLGHTICNRPMFPLEPDAVFAPKVELYRRG
mgnify:CR=1 FL=1